MHHCLQPSLFLSLSLSLARAQIVFDSPCKTYEEIREALLSGVTLNANTVHEVAKVRYAAIYP
jgi:diaminopimelate decarboxylase